MTPKRILVLGGGFAGLWSAVGAARSLDELGIGPETAEITLVNRDRYHGIRVRNYESDLHRVRIPLDQVLEPVGVRRCEGEIRGVDPVRQIVRVATAERERTLPFDRLIVALGSQVLRPKVPGLKDHGFDIDTYGGAERLAAHLQGLATRPATAGSLSVVVVGAGLTGIEAAAEMPEKLRNLLAGKHPFRVLLVDHAPRVGSDMGEEARGVIEAALASLGIETRVGVSVRAIDPDGVTLSSGETIPAATVVWCAGMGANPLTKAFAAERDRFGRLPVDPFLRVEGVAGVFAAGDVARLMVDGRHASVMSCQHARPMGRFAGHNAVCDLFGQPMLPLRIPWYVTVLDLGTWGAVYTEGWERRVITTGETAKATKRLINGQRIYPPLDGDRRAILAAAAPIVQQPPPARPPSPTSPA
jgi:NADH dehydrogenase